MLLKNKLIEHDKDKDLPKDKDIDKDKDKTSTKDVDNTTTKTMTSAEDKDKTTTKIMVKTKDILDKINNKVDIINKINRRLAKMKIKIAKKVELIYGSMCELQDEIYSDDGMRFVEKIE